MNIQKTNRNFAEEYFDIKEKLMKDPYIRARHNDPIKDWQTWIDLDNEDLRKLTEYLLSELVFNRPLTAMGKFIPLIEDSDIMVGVTVYIDKKSIMENNKILHDYTPVYISTNDLINVLNKLIDEDKDYHMREAFYRIAHELHIVQELQDRRK